MMKSKWLKVLALTLVAAFSIAMLAGCSGGTTQPTTAPTQAPANNGGDGEGSNEPAQAKDPSVRVHRFGHVLVRRQKLG